MKTALVLVALGAITLPSASYGGERWSPVAVGKDGSQFAIDSSSIKTVQIPKQGRMLQFWWQVIESDDDKSEPYRIVDYLIMDCKGRVGIIHESQFNRAGKVTMTSDLSAHVNQIVESQMSMILPGSVMEEAQRVVCERAAR